jgi:YD repeat-containing protein
LRCLGRPRGHSIFLQSPSKSNSITTFSYDALGRRTGVTDPHTGQAVTHYDAEGRVDYVRDAAGHLMTFGYDYSTSGKLKTRTWARQEGGQPLVTTYGNPAGRP